MRKLLSDGEVNSFEVGATCEEEEIHWDSETYEEIRDNITGQILDKELVAKARTEELELIEKPAVWKVVPTQECWNETGAKPIGVRWVDINKGDGE